MKKLKYIIFSVMALMLVMTGCKSKETVTEEQSAEALVAEGLMRSLADTYTPWETYTVSGKLNLSGKVSFSTSMQLKMVKDKLIIISVRPVLGIELAKVYFTNESAVVVNKVNRVYSTLPLDQIAHIVPANVGAIQDVFLSRVFTLADGTLSQENIKKFNASMKDGALVITPRKQEKEFEYVFYVDKNMQLTSVDILPTSNNKVFTGQYKGYTAEKGGVASTIKLETKISGKTQVVELNMTTAKAKWNEKVDEEISIPKSYNKVTVEEFIKILSKY